MLGLRLIPNKNYLIKIKEKNNKTMVFSGTFIHYMDDSFVDMLQHTHTVVSKTTIKPPDSTIGTLFTASHNPDYSDDDDSDDGSVLYTPITYPFSHVLYPYVSDQNGYLRPRSMGLFKFNELVYSSGMNTTAINKCITSHAFINTRRLQNGITLVWMNLYKDKWYNNIEIREQVNKHAMISKKATDTMVTEGKLPRDVVSQDINSYFGGVFSKKHSIHKHKSTKRKYSTIKKRKKRE